MLTNLNSDSVRFSNTEAVLQFVSVIQTLSAGLLCLGVVTMVRPQSEAPEEDLEPMRRWSDLGGYLLHIT